MKNAPLAILAICALIVTLSIGTAAFSHAPGEVDRTWSAEALIYMDDLGPQAMGVTYMAERPYLVALHVGLKQYPNLLRWVLMHELTHALGYNGHPFADEAWDPAVEPDDTVILMDAFPCFDMMDCPDVIEVSQLEREFYRQCNCTLFLSPDADSIELVDACMSVAQQLNCLAGREMIVVRVGPLSLR